MNIDEAVDVLDQLVDFYGRKKMPTVASKHWVKGIMKFNRLAANRALTDVWDSTGTMPTRGAFLAACHNRQAEMFPVADSSDVVIEPWEHTLGKAVMPHFMDFLRGRDSLNNWANNYRAIARAQGVEGKIDWAEWESRGATFFI